MGNSTELYYLLEQGNEYKRAPGVTDGTLAAALEQRRLAESLFDPSGAPEWVKDDFLMLDLLYRAVEMRIKAPGKAKRRCRRS